MSVRFGAFVGLSLVASVSLAWAADTDVRLAEAAKREDRSAIRALIDQKVEVNAALPDGG